MHAIVWESTRLFGGSAIVGKSTRSFGSRRDRSGVDAVADRCIKSLVIFVYGEDIAMVVSGRIVDIQLRGRRCDNLKSGTYSM